MDLGLTDLDALCLYVRDPLTRSYIEESIKAYRAGSYKASIVSIWVAVTFDIIAKIKELADQGEAAAIDFTTVFESNVKSKNVKKLLEIEGDLLEVAEKRFEFIDPINRRHFDRLKEDRNLCAHPAFTADGQLFTPEPELVRLYLVEAIRNLLSQSPTQGRKIIDRFDSDLRSLSFPASAEEVTRFVASRYLVNSRTNVHSSFMIVLAKAMLKQTPPGWDAKISLLPAALQAIRSTNHTAWTMTLRSISDLVEAADDRHLPNAYSLLIHFDDLRAALSELATARLLAYIENIEPTDVDVRVFEAAALPAFADAARVKFAESTSVTQTAVLKRFPFRPFWETSCTRLAKSNSFRNSEYIFGAYISPFCLTATPDQLTHLFTAIISNPQVWHASGIPGDLTNFVSAVSKRHLLDASHLTGFLSFLDERDAREIFSEVLEIFCAAGVSIPPAPNPRSTFTA